MKLSNAIDKFLLWGEQKYSSGTVRAYKQHLKDFEKVVAKKNINSISLEDVLKYQRCLSDKGLSPATIFRYSVAIRGLFRLASREGDTELDYTLIPTPKYSSTSWHAIESCEFDKVLDSVKSDSEFLRLRNKLVLRFLYSSGVRVSELVDIRINTLNVYTREAIILTKKSNKPRLILWDGETGIELKKYLEERLNFPSSEYLFTNKRGRKLTPRQVQRIVKEVRELAGINYKLVPHSFRHGYGMRGVAKNMNLRYLQVLMGHESITSTQIYMKYSDQNVKDEYKRIFDS